MAPSTFLVEFRKFCQTTSVRGVPRIINSKSSLHSVIWALGVLTCAGLLCWQMTVIFKRYFSYGFNTVLVRSPDWDNATFPDITICNLFPLINDKEMNLSYIDYYNTFKNQFTYEEFKNVYNLLYRINNTNLINSTFSVALQFFKSPSGYFLNFPILSHIGQDYQDAPIVDCSYFDWDYYTPMNYNCVASIQQHWMPNFYKCYTLALNDTYRKAVLGFSAVIYVDNFFDSLHGLYTLGLGSTQATGMQVLIHARGSAPDMSQGIPVGTGMSTTITLDQIQVSHLSSPYSNCTTQKTIGELDLSTSYTDKYCTHVCLQKQYLEACGCIFSSLQFTAGQLRQANYTMCGNISINDMNASLNWDGVTKLLCAIKLEKNQTICKQECLTPCDEYQYKLNSNAAPWPHKSAQISFYKQYIEGNSRYGNQFDVYAIVLNTAQNNSELNAFLQKTDQDGVLKNRFLQLNIQFNSPSYLQQKDVADFSFDAFGAQVGGVLSLWLGVTVILVFELCEVVINLCTADYFNKRNKEADSKENNDTKL